RGLRRHLEQRPAPPWQGQALYPSGPFSLWGSGSAVYFHYSHSLCWDRAGLARLRAEHPEARDCLEALEAFLAGHYMVGTEVPPEFRLGGDGFTHSIPHYGRVCGEGLDGYAARIRAGLQASRGRGDDERAAFYEALEDLLLGVRAWHRRCAAAVRAAAAPAEGAGGPAGSAWEATRQRLLAALERVPLAPARSFYEALVCTNWIFYLDGCDSLGRIDQELGPYYERDVTSGRLDAEEGRRLVRLLWENVDANSGWNAAIGGSTAEGGPAYNALTRVCLQAARRIRRPNLALRVRRDMPDLVWDEVLETLASGCGLPALYSEEAYLAALQEAHLGLRAEDLPEFAFGGCTETMVHGRSNVGSLDAGINLPEILSQVLEAQLERATDFDALFAAYRGALCQAIARLTAGVSRDQELKARHQPQPVRSLLIDDCIDEGVEYNAGGARHHWSVVNVGGLANVADSLAAVQKLVYQERSVSPDELLAALRTDFAGHQALRRRLEACPRFGNDEPEADALACQVAQIVFGELRRYAPWRGGRFLPACLMFVTYAGAGEHVPATPDGRRAGTPIADSAGPVQGRDRRGPTAMLRSVARLPQQMAPGTLVVNARFARDMFTSAEQRQRLRQLIRGYFDLGGLQLQVNVVDQAVLRDALEHPERHEDLIVRVGGYSEYFHRLSRALQESILERTEHR
ncbi:MAG: pyruvate formate lyase family protein, partial [Candidatus Latescibacterota bacterium]